MSMLFALKKAVNSKTDEFFRIKHPILLPPPVGNLSWNNVRLLFALKKAVHSETDDFLETF